MKDDEYVKIDFTYDGHSYDVFKAILEQLERIAKALESLVKEEAK